MLSGRNLLVLMGIPLVFALPLMGYVLLGNLQGNKDYQPFTIPNSELSYADGNLEALAIIVKIDWGETYPGSVTKASLQELITQNLTFRTDDFAFEVNDVPGNRVGVTFKVSHNVYGPFPPNGWLDGMKTSLIALQAVETSRDRWGPN